MTWLLDTNILIDYSRNHAAAVHWMESNLHACAMPVLAVAEYAQGTRNEAEQEVLRALCQAMPVIPLTQEMAEIGGVWAQQYRASHGSSLHDCLIAATAKVEGLQLASLNTKHFPMCEGLQRPY